MLFFWLATVCFYRPIAAIKIVEVLWDFTGTSRLYHFYFVQYGTIPFLNWSRQSLRGPCIRRWIVSRLHTIFMHKMIERYSGIWNFCDRCHDFGITSITLSGNVTTKYISTRVMYSVASWTTPRNLQRHQIPLFQESLLVDAWLKSEIHMGYFPTRRAFQAMTRKMPRQRGMSAKRNTCDSYLSKARGQNVSTESTYTLLLDAC